jgi:hypothetical protein
MIGAQPHVPSLLQHLVGRRNELQLSHCPGSHSHMRLRQRSPSPHIGHINMAPQPSGLAPHSSASQVAVGTHAQRPALSHIPLMQSAGALHFLPTPHFAQMAPPQSVSLSSWFNCASSQSGVTQENALLQLPDSQSSLTTQLLPSVHLPQSAPPQSALVSMPFFRPSSQLTVGAASVPVSGAPESTIGGIVGRLPADPALPAEPPLPVEPPLPIEPPLPAPPLPPLPLPPTGTKGCTPESRDPAAGAPDAQAAKPQRVTTAPSLTAAFMPTIWGYTTHRRLERGRYPTVPDPERPCSQIGPSACVSAGKRTRAALHHAGGCPVGATPSQACESEREPQHEGRELCATM